MNRLVRSFLAADTLVCLPLLVLVGTVVCFVLAELPRMEAVERMRVVAHYRSFAEAIKDGELTGREVPLLDRKASGRIGRGSWGLEEDGGKVRVWYREARGIMAREVEVEAIPVANLRIRYCLFGGLLLLSMLALIDWGLLKFRRFVVERDEFLAAAAHDLRTPVAALQLLIGHDDEMARQVVARMRMIVVNLTGYIRRGGNCPEPQMERFDLIGAFEEAYGLFKNDFKESSAAIELPTAGGLEAYGDRSRTVQILWNLLGNALKYAIPHGRVQVRPIKGNDWVGLEVADSGPGMRPWEIRRAFRRCFRSRSARESGKGGLGLGLCISRELARSMGGDLRLRANVPTGCVFTLVLKSGSGPNGKKVENG